ncbi:bifunctional folylpolyglutamate synthase/dihydrofolate synthase [Bacillus sp. Bva_UNVM-123]|uniref:bifunctional folylpolyglutamate synthase/dihydrofolate synthase n=1 Tax=Bacillus sp. Bva_UNVM-123 TaxID=2829798 RepID=UPI00391F5ED0
MFTTYEEAISWIHSRLRLGIKPGLKRMEWMMDKLDHPERRIKSVHIGGTNGKGSTVTYLRSILQEAGYLVGTFTSPYFEQFNERISLNGVPIKDEEIVQLANDIFPLALELENSELGGPTEFEIITAMAMQYFGHVHPADIVLFEVGLGGRFDSTNIIHPILSIITNIGLDHTAILGDTYEKIATEKAGIIKAGTAIVSAVKQTEAIEVITNRALEVKAPLYLLGNHFSISNHRSTATGEVFTQKTPFSELVNLEISMAGKHQTENASLAVMGAQLLKWYFSFLIDEEHIQKGLTKAYWPGRFEMLSNDPVVVIDGAHNEEGVTALVSELETRFQHKKINIIFAALADKKLDSMIMSLDRVASKITFVDFDYPRAANAEDLFKLSQNVNKHVNKDWKCTIKEEISLLKEEEVLIVTGSLYFLSAVKPYLLKTLENDV